jgi:hypothetical protein
VAVEQLAALAAGAKLAISTASAMIPMFVRVSLLFMSVLQSLFLSAQIDFLLVPFGIAPTFSP